MGNNIKIPFGICKGQIIHISSAVPGEKYECCECGGELIPIISNKIASHFRHKIECKCDGGVSRVGGESPIHKYAKKIILEEKKVYIDEDKFIEFREVKEEYKINGTERIVDLYCATNDYREIAIEIFYKHKVEGKKVQELKDSKVRNALEINIPDITNFRDENEIRKGIIKNFVRDMLINTDFTEENRWRKEKLDKFEINLYKWAKEEMKKYTEHIQEINSATDYIDDIIVQKEKKISELNQDIERTNKSKKCIEEHWDSIIFKKEYEVNELTQVIGDLKKSISELEFEKCILQDEINIMKNQIKMNI